MDLLFEDASALAERLQRGELSCRALLEQQLARVEERNPALNAVVVLDAERARARAAEADRALSRGERWGPLHGVPMTVKESFDVAGLPTTWGDPAARHNVADQDALVVQRLRQAGAVIFGKTNVPLGLHDLQSSNELYGTTRNPWDLTRGPGGSSGGEAAALAAGLSTLGAGSDIAGSIRNPAHYCGVYGHKPTFGVVPHEGHSLTRAAAEPDLCVYGPLARSARDLRLALDVLAGAGPLRSPGWQLHLPEPSRPLGALRVALWADDPLAPVESVIAARCHAVGEALGRAGAQVSDRARPELDPGEAHRCYAKLLNAAVSVDQDEQAFAALRRRASGFSPDDESRAARAAWNALMPHRSWLQLHEQRTQLRRRWRAFFERWDLLVCPVAATAAFPHQTHTPLAERRLAVNGREVPYFQQLFWAGLASLPGLPSTVIPTGVDERGLPIGVQLVGPEFGDRRTIEVARQLAERLGGFVSPDAAG